MSTSTGAQYQRDELVGDAAATKAPAQQVDHSTDTTPRCTSTREGADVGSAGLPSEGIPGSPAVVESEITEKVMFVLVECNGFASCLFNSRNGDCRTQFGNGLY